MNGPLYTLVTGPWCWQAEIAAKLVAKAQHLARIAKADAAGRLELQRSASATASSLHRVGTEQKHMGRTASVSQSCVTHAANASEEHLVQCFVHTVMKRSCNTFAEFFECCELVAFSQEALLCIFLCDCQFYTFHLHDIKVEVWAHVTAGRVHSKTRAGVAALATRKGHDPQALSAEDDPTNTQPQQQQQQQQRQQQQQQQQHWVSALPKQSSCECSTAFSALRHAHAGTKRSQKAASLLAAAPLQTPFKSCRVDLVLPSSPAQPSPGVGTCRRRHAFTHQAAEAVTAPALGLQASQPSNVCQMPAADSSSPCSSCTVGSPEGQLGSTCQLQSAKCQQSCCPKLLPRPGLHAHMHRQSSRDSACNWTDTGAEASCIISHCSGSTTLLACITSEPRGEDNTVHETGLLFPGPGHAQRMDRHQGAHPETSETAAALRQQHQLHMIDLMLARVSAAEEAIHMGLAPPAQPDSCFQSHHDPWEPAGSSNMLHQDMETGTHREVDFSAIDTLLLCDRQQAQCKLEQPAVMDDSTSSFRDASSANGPDNMLEGCTERTHSSSGSSIECPGCFLVPTDWLNDQPGDEVDLDYFSTISTEDSTLGLTLPFMPPSLQH